MHSHSRPAMTTTMLVAAVGLLAACTNPAKPPAFELSGRIQVEGTAQFQQPVLIDGQGKKWILDCAGGAAHPLQGRQAVATVRVEGAAAASTLGVPRVCVVSIKAQ